MCLDHNDIHLFGYSFRFNFDLLMLVAKILRLVAIPSVLLRLLSVKLAHSLVV